MLLMFFQFVLYFMDKIFIKITKLNKNVTKIS
jgi:hypothetical protein